MAKKMAADAGAEMKDPSNLPGNIDVLKSDLKSDLKSAKGSAKVWLQEAEAVEGRDFTI